MKKRTRYFVRRPDDMDRRGITGSADSQAHAEDVAHWLVGCKGGQFAVYLDRSSDEPLATYGRAT